MIRKGMTVRTPDGERLGHVARVGESDFAIRRGIIGHEFLAPLTAVIAFDDEHDELICRPVDLPWIDREIEDSWFGAPGTPEGADQLENKREEAELLRTLEPEPPEPLDT